MNLGESDFNLIVFFLVYGNGVDSHMGTLLELTEPSKTYSSIS